MRVTAVRIFHVLPRWTFVAVDTDAGITGYGEPVVEGQSRVVEAAVQHFAEYLVGKDPLEIERHWQVMYRGGFYRGGAVGVSAISGLEHALWDIKGKFYGAPVFEMLGGRARDRMRMYGHGRGTTDADFVDAALRAKARGLTAIKIGIDGPARDLESLDYVDRQVRRFAAVRDAVGPAFDIAVDMHGRTTPATAKRIIAGFEPYHPLWVEEPCLPENVDAMLDIASSTTVPIASGERRFTKWEFRELIDRRAVSVIQPDLCHAGGILEAKKIAAMAEAQYISVAPHNPLGPISLAACLQLDACTPNFMIQEHPTADDGADLGVGLLSEPFEIVDGFIDVPTGPGLGIQPDEDLFVERRYPGDWRNPVFVHEDGGHGDW
ncbi:galactonate dehydratase [Paraoerskovia sediminicola]|uniref:Galactonate dehydratase n=1 Tax=Paraoerskovia sediminicola TaxID=1138587 RepID=A0ABN6XED9_9CELL|nr:galactonate dehydratase [Paraoerskovia sediminicola]BDZ41956.1 galactonate dehydratase [Paraoerskovia sediminicola]